MYFISCRVTHNTVAFQSFYTYRNNSRSLSLTLVCVSLSQCKVLEQRMEQGMVFTEYEQVAKRRPAGDCSIAQLPESGERNRFQDVLPYDDTRVELVPTKENNTGYINASHIRVMLDYIHHMLKYIL